MATTIVTKNSSTAAAVPTAAQLVQGELAVNVADKRIYTEDNGGAIVELGTNPSAEIVANGGIALPDNGKATFGAGDDLQIYHDGTNSYIDNTGAGSLIIQDTDGTGDIFIRPKSGQTAIAAYNDNTVQLAHSGNVKLSTTSTGIDVTGTATMDGLVVDGVARVDGNVIIGRTTGSYVFTEVDGGSERAGIHSSADNDLTFKVSNQITAINIDGTTRDISFYEDTGTTAKLFWDASAESLGIGTSAPSAAIHAVNSAASDESIAIFESAGTKNGYVYINGDANRRKSLVFQSAGVDKFSMGVGDSDELSENSFFIGSGKTGGSGADLVIDSAGFVGIGTSSPASTLEIAKNDQTNGATLSITNSHEGSGWTAGDTVGSIDFRIDDSSAPEKVRGQIKVFDDTSVSTTYPAYSAMSFSTSLLGTFAERMRIDSAGALLLHPNNASRGLTITTTQTTAVGDTTTYNTIGAGYGRHVFQTDSVERMRIDSAGHAIIPNGVTLGTAVGVYSAAKTLDDYEEGTFTPTLTRTIGGDISATYTAQNGVYTKIGNLVYFQIYIVLSEIASQGTGYALLTGLPYSSNQFAYNQISHVSGNLFGTTDVEKAFTSAASIYFGGTGATDFPPLQIAYTVGALRICGTYKTS